MRRKILLPVLLVLVAALGIGLYLWNKPRPKAEDQTGTAITAEELYSQFATDENAANGRFLDKVMQVSGKVAEISQNQDGRQVILLETSDPLGGVQCTMREAQPTLGLKQEASVKGFCNGFTSVVILSDCVLVKP